MAKVRYICEFSDHSIIVGLSARWQRPLSSYAKSSMDIFKGLRFLLTDDIDVKNKGKHLIKLPTPSMP